MLRQQLKRLENCAQRDDGSLDMKSQLVAIVAAVPLVGCEALFGVEKRSLIFWTPWS
jgi:hypothetical protein